MRMLGTGDISTRITERKGICEIEKRCCLINWIFRERGHTDFGIDADMEEAVLYENEYRLTNRHIAIQIKSGDSYIKKDKKGQYYFDIDDIDHANYWLGSDRPVIVMVFEAPNMSNCYSTSPDEDGLFGKVYWAQIKPSSLVRISNRVSKNDLNPKTKDKATHKFARIYLTEEFTKDSASAFSNIISSYIPTYVSDFKAPSVILNTKYFEQLCKHLFGALESITSFIDDFYSCVNDKGTFEDVNSLSIAIENLCLHLLYNRNIDNLLIVRYLDAINQFNQIDQLNFQQFKAYRDKAILDSSNSITKTIDLLDTIKKILRNIRDVLIDQNILCGLINQTCHSIDDYSMMLQVNLSCFPHI